MLVLLSEGTLRLAQMGLWRGGNVGVLFRGHKGPRNSLRLTVSKDFEIETKKTGNREG